MRFRNASPDDPAPRSFGFQDWALLPNVAVLDGVERSLVIVGKRITH